MDTRARSLLLPPTALVVAVAPALRPWRPAPGSPHRSLVPARAGRRAAERRTAPRRARPSRLGRRRTRPLRACERGERVSFDPHEETRRGGGEDERWTCCRCDTANTARGSAQVARGESEGAHHPDVLAPERNTATRRASAAAKSTSVIISPPRGDDSQRDPEQLEALAALDPDARLVVAVLARAHLVALLLEPARSESRVSECATAGRVRLRDWGEVRRVGTHLLLTPKTIGRHRNMA